MKNLLIVYHSKTGNTLALAERVLQGAKHEDVSGVEVRYLTATEAGPADLLWAHGLLLGTPENFGYMSDFFDRTFYEVEGRLNPLPYALFVSAGNDGTGAVRAIERIANGYPLQRFAEPIISRGTPDDATLTACSELGTSLAAGLELGIY